MFTFLNECCRLKLRNEDDDDEKKSNIKRIDRKFTMPTTATKI